jgi:hypothetical protein
MQQRYGFVISAMHICVNRSAVTRFEPTSRPRDWHFIGEDSGNLLPRDEWRSPLYEQDVGSEMRILR